MKNVTDVKKKLLELLRSAENENDAKTSVEEIRKILFFGLKSEDEVLNKFALYLMKKRSLVTIWEPELLMEPFNHTQLQHKQTHVQTMTMFYSIYESIQLQDDHLILDHLASSNLSGIAENLPHAYYNCLLVKLFASRSLTTPSLLKIALYFLNITTSPHETRLFRDDLVGCFLPFLTQLLSRQPLYTATVLKGSFDSRFGNALILFFKTNVSKICKPSQLLPHFPHIFTSLTSRISSFYLLESFLAMPPGGVENDECNNLLTVDDWRIVVGALKGNFGSSVYMKCDSVVKMQLRQIFSRFSTCKWSIDFSALLQLVSALWDDSKDDTEFSQWVLNGADNVAFTAYLNRSLVDKDLPLNIKALAILYKIVDSSSGFDLDFSILYNTENLELDADILSLLVSLNLSVPSHFTQALQEYITLAISTASPLEIIDLAALSTSPPPPDCDKYTQLQFIRPSRLDDLYQYYIVPSLPLAAQTHHFATFYTTAQQLLISPASAAGFLEWGKGVITSTRIIHAIPLFTSLYAALDLIDAADVHGAGFVESVVALFEEDWTAPQWTDSLDSALRFLLHPSLCRRVDDVGVLAKKVEEWGLIRGDAVLSFASYFVRVLDLSGYADLMVELCTWGPIRHSTEDKINNVLDYGVGDYRVRVIANARVLGITDATTGRALMDALFLCLSESKDFKRQRFLDSLQQRKAVRAWQTLHLLFEFIEDPVVVFGKVWRLLSREKCVETVYIIEWFVMRLLRCHPAPLYCVYKETLDKVDANQGVSSLLIILAKLAPTLDLPWLLLGMEHGMLWMSDKNYTVRVFAQILITRTWRLVVANHAALVGEYGYVDKLCRHLERNPDYLKASEKTTAFYFYSDAFGVEENVSIEFLWRSWSEMVGTSAEERISSSAFYKVLKEAGGLDTTRVPLGFEERLKIGEMVGKSRRIDKVLLEEKKREEDIDIVVDEDDAAAATATEKQKKKQSEKAFAQRKIMPWEKLMDAGIEMGISDKTAEKPRNTLLIIASLISKPANLGGLCRTSETFNAEVMVVESLGITKDPIFQNLCVTSQLWMPLIEVKPDSLHPYLLQQKTKGYSLIGIEQATNSVSLSAFQFPGKACLVLGREKEGLPAELLAIMDHIVEIPQFGFIKSLNVHVSGSLCIWEYMKQQIASGNAV